MNHYERLKVTRDAPPEVIRAAYRALANRLHPDRNGGAGGPDDAAHDQMAELNAAYEVLIDPKLRLDYDATLEPIRVSAARAAAVAAASVGAPGPDGADDAGLGDAALQRPWQGAVPLSSRPAWAPGSRQVLAGLGLGSVLVVAAMLAMWRMGMDSPLDRAITTEVVRQPGLNTDSMTPSGQPTAVTSAVTPGQGRRPTVEELAQMSDEELVKALPALDGRPGASARAERGLSTPASASLARGPHVLDGTPVRLRVDTHLVDPLAPASSARP